MQQAERMTRAVDGAIAQLQRLLGPEHVITDPHELAFYSHDVYRAGLLPAAVIRPGSTDELAAALAARRDGILAQAYADLVAAGLPLPEIVGPVFEVGGYSAGAYDVQCHVSFSLKDPDRYDLALAGEAGLVRSSRKAPQQCRRLYLFDRQDVLNPRKR